MYFGFSSTSPSRDAVGAAGEARGRLRALRGGCRIGLRRCRPGLHALAHGEPHDRSGRARLGGSPAHQVEEVALDPVASEVVRNLDDELTTVERTRLSVPEPRVVRRLGERVAQPAGYGVPEVFGS